MITNCLITLIQRLLNYFVNITKNQQIIDEYLQALGNIDRDKKQIKLLKLAGLKLATNKQTDYYKKEIKEKICLSIFVNIDNKQEINSQFNVSIVCC